MIGFIVGLFSGAFLGIAILAFVINAMYMKNLSENEEEE